MRIAINCRSFLNRQYTGIGRYAYNLVKSLSEIDHDNEYWLYAQKKYFDFKRQVPRISAKNFFVKIDWLGRGIDRTLHPADIYHSPSPDYINISQAKIIVTVHDLVYKTYPEGHTPQTIETTDKQLKMIVEKADKIICCSKSTIKDLLYFFKVDPQKVCLVYQGVDKAIFYPINDIERRKAQSIIKRKGLIRPFILFVGTIEPRKNLMNLLKAFSILKEKKRFNGQLVVIGMKGWMIEGLEQVTQKFKIQNSVLFPGYVTDELLRYFYNLTEVFVFPSFYEGFGFPIVEAFSCGTTVITSNVSSCPEIACEGANLINPHSPEEIANAIGQVIEDEKLRLSLKEKALKRAEEFSFLKTAQQTFKIYQEVYDSSDNG